jgi:hypothetical protein
MRIKINRFENPFEDKIHLLSTLMPIIILSLIKILAIAYFFYLGKMDIITISFINPNCLLKEY